MYSKPSLSASAGQEKQVSHLGSGIGVLYLFLNSLEFCNIIKLNEQNSIFFTGNSDERSRWLCCL